jgi:hypothetical protein
MKSDSKHRTDLLTDVARAIGSSLGTVVGKTNAFTAEAGHIASKVSRPKAASERNRAQTGRARRRSRSMHKTRRKNL